MKTKFYSLVAIAAMFAASTGISSALGGTKEGGNGGGGIHRDGKYLTFGSSKTKLSLSFLSENEIPGFRSLNASLGTLALPVDVKMKLVTASVPSKDRNYFAIRSKNANPAIVRALLKEYRKMIDEEIPAGQLVIHAFTIEQDTYLLPSFFELRTEAEQASILFHESLWKSGADSYNDVMNAEIRYEQWLENGMRYDASLYIALSKVFDDGSIDVVAAAQDDLANGRLTPFQSTNKGSCARSADHGGNVEDNALPLSFVMPFQLLRTWNSRERIEEADEHRIIGRRSKSIQKQIDFDRLGLKTHYMKMSQQHPKIATFAALLRNANLLSLRLVLLDENNTDMSRSPENIFLSSDGSIHFQQRASLERTVCVQDYDGSYRCEHWNWSPLFTEDLLSYADLQIQPWNINKGAIAWDFAGPKEFVCDRGAINGLQGGKYLIQLTLK